MKNHDIKKIPALRLATLSIFVLLGGLSLVLSSCVQDVVDTQPISVERVFSASPEEISRAIKQVMVKYPQRVDNLDAGIFETDYVKGDQRFKPPGQNPHYGAGYRYRILIHLLKGHTEGKRASTKVVVNKVVEEQSDFFSDADNKTSDKLEEQIILYRIQRELNMEKASQRLLEKQNQDSRQNFQQ